MQTLPSDPINVLPARIHADAIWLARRARGRLGADDGQGTVEYVGLILLVSLLMAGMVAAMKGFRGNGGKELAEAIMKKMQEAVSNVRFK